MVRTNPERRQALLDASIEVLAREGARGLTFRAVDQEAGVPAGTASNYFPNRDALLVQVGHRYYERLIPSEEAMAKSRGPQTRETMTELMTEVVERVFHFRTGYLAILELRLEATRRPELQALLTERVRADLDFNISNFRESQLPGDEDAVVLLYLALNWLILERLTLPGIFDEKRAAELVRTIVERAIPAAG
ncbi:TetR family transcriptional regulator [Nocardia sp. 852002-20019_SCH5090214]|uniref:TetR/AcrR family transcriptional regulator n=1 Tax=Nocardia nova TaxID=37330 RepID=A0A2S6A3A7_9NOCA|nr:MULTISPECIES: TetR/AcrR family transcriptional regulator [Nocardia]OBF81700.1 TetR family transcriptional regulator [Mycobacterium sp. 852002-51759_SCH5129042]MBV7707275.1 TetR family transcriptional regulator [Nocardia nova]OBA40375.1 TetR family transcriptional regulator [Nocardia sp. 852002-20019_SCH5090214]OBA53219.1 TetR family transcriptional regulator [Nocardia sp. 852002-51101_SCH5132738]OBB51215.1 TetR family transcriptional regulator [Nocardia sp. 852002-51244_SCH5132740]